MPADVIGGPIATRTLPTPVPQLVALMANRDVAHHGSSAARGRILTGMASRLTDVSLWRRSLWLFMAYWGAANAVRVMQDPEAIRFFAFWIEVAAAVGTVGSVVALLIVAFRKIAGTSSPPLRHRLF